MSGVLLGAAGWGHRSLETRQRRLPSGVFAATRDQHAPAPVGLDRLELVRPCRRRPGTRDHAGVVAHRRRFTDPSSHRRLRPPLSLLPSAKSQIARPTPEKNRQNQERGQHHSRRDHLDMTSSSPPHEDFFSKKKLNSNFPPKSFFFFFLNF